MYDNAFPRTAYIRRDGRDVMVSLYHYQHRSITHPRHPRQAARLRARFRHLFGVNYDPLDVRKNLPLFIEAESVEPTAFRGATWSEHVHSWCSSAHGNVVVTAYESLLAQPVQEFAKVLEFLTDEAVDKRRLRISLDRYSFDRTGRQRGEEDLDSFMRKGVAGDWRQHFDRCAGETFSYYHGETLMQFGYESDPRWYTSLPS
ncbi:sulfotransferase domain-containing protein [Ornithinimicrobium cavernae]|uniref:sulfotransferase domain-containing protein n=1 Tax=Ornithinimicrobium cavernae TaxID=2666047 RepID=UPI00137951CB|nr:sulfotransferase domain-containing protein [Ornithinimicrobium cavernae]